MLSTPLGRIVLATRHGCSPIHGDIFPQAAAIGKVGLQGAYNLYTMSLCDYYKKLIAYLDKLPSAASANAASTSGGPKNHDAEAIITACKAGEYDKAIELAEGLAAAGPGRADLEDVLLEAAGTLAQAKQYAFAARFYRMLIERCPESKRLKDARTELAACYYYSRQLDKCLEQVKANLKLYPDSPWVEYWHFLAAQIPFRLYDFAEAKAALEKFLADYPNGDYAKNARECLSLIDPPLQINKNSMVRYSGRFSNDIRLQTAVKALPEYVGDGFRLLEKRLGVDLRPHTNVLYCFKDAGQETNGGLKATTRIIGRNNKPATIIYFYTQSVVTNREAFRKTIVHEMKHAGFLGIMGQRYHELPEWVREGLALWGSEDVEKRVQLVLCNAIAGGKDPDSVLDGIEDPDHDDRDYLEDGLAFEWLASNDPNNISAFCRRLVNGEPYRKIWADLSGASYADAMAAANAYCRRRVEAALGEGYKTFAPLRKESDAVMRQGADATRKWLDDGGKVRFEQWLTGNAGHAAEPMARLSLARSLIVAGQYDAARELLKKILEEDGCRSTLMDDAQFWMGVSYNYQRDFANARRVFGEFLRDYPNSPNAKQLSGKMPVAGPVSE